MKRVIRLGLNPWRDCSQIGNTGYETTGSSSKISGLHISGGSVPQRTMQVDGKMDHVKTCSYFKFSLFTKHRQKKKKEISRKWLVFSPDGSS